MVLSLEVLEENREFKNLQKYNWQGAGSELAICTAHIEGCRAELRALRHHYALRVKIRLADFNLVPQIYTRSSSVIIHIHVPNTEQFAFYVCTYFPH